MRVYLVNALAPYLGADLASILAPGWFTMVALGWIVGTYAAIRIGRARGLDSRLLLRALFAGYLAAVLSGIAGPILFDLATQWLEGRPLRLRWSGMTSWFGIVGGLAAIAIVLRKGGKSLETLDCLALPAGLALVFARLGCFIAGCDFGNVSSGPLALRFPAYSPAWRAHVEAGWMPASSPESLAVHPTQLYEAALGVVLVAIFYLLARRPRLKMRPGGEFLLACGIYGLGRFAVEALRGDVARGVYYGLSTGQWMSVLLLAALAVHLLRSLAVRHTLVAAAALLVGLHGQVVHADEVAKADESELAADEPQASAKEPRRSFDVSALVVSSTPMNRPSGQVPQLGGFTLAGNVDVGGGLSLGADIESMANDVAIHRTLFLCAQIRRSLTPAIELGVRGGFGLTVVDFTDPAFETITAVGGLRSSATLQYWPTDQWSLAVWPLTIDFLNHRDLGGSILSYQFRVGVTWGPRSTPTSKALDATAPATVPAAPYPAPAPITAPNPAPGSTPAPYTAPTPYRPPPPPEAAPSEPSPPADSSVPPSAS